MNRASSLAGRVALVTGASRGIGRAIARRLAAHGAAVVVSSSVRSAAQLHETCALIRDSGGSAQAVLCELSDAEARAQLAAEAMQAFGSIDVLVNNAATITAYAPPSKMDLKARRDLFEVNLQAPIDLAQQLLPGMKARQWGRILNITSDTAHQPPIPYVGPAKFIHALALYGVSKAALDRYTVGLAAELSGTGIHVNALAPFKICASESAAPAVASFISTRPDWVEPVEMMAEAAYLLTSGALTGLVIKSREVLTRMQSPLHALDGTTVIGDAASLMPSR